MAASAGTIHVGVELTGAQTRIEALDRSVRIAIATGGMDMPKTIIDRAEVFAAFLNGGTA